MPQVFKVGSYWVYFWTNEGDPLEPIHVHISEGSPSPNATKVWITKSGKCLPPLLDWSENRQTNTANQEWRTEHPHV